MKDLQSDSGSNKPQSILVPPVSVVIRVEAYELSAFVLRGRLPMEGQTPGCLREKNGDVAPPLYLTFARIQAKSKTTI